MVNKMFLDEFIATQGYLMDEFILFTSLLSTIKRLRQNFKVFLCGNSINKFNPYFKEMGLVNCKNQKKNTILCRWNVESKGVCENELSSKRG